MGDPRSGLLTSVTPVPPLGFAVPGVVIIATARLAWINTAIATAPALIMLAFAFPLFLILTTVGVGPATPLVTLVLTLLGSTLLVRVIFFIHVLIVGRLGEECVILGGIVLGGLIVVVVVLHL